MRCRGSLYINTGHLLSGAAGPALPVLIPGFAKRPSAERPPAFRGVAGGGAIITHRHHQHFLETQVIDFFFFFLPGT